MVDKGFLTRTGKTPRMCADLVPLWMTYAALEPEENCCVYRSIIHTVGKRGRVGSGISSVALKPTLILLLLSERQ